MTKIECSTYKSRAFSLFMFVHIYTYIYIYVCTIHIPIEEYTNGYIKISENQWYSLFQKIIEQEIQRWKKVGKL